MKMANEFDTYPMPADGWVCFHCGERFRTEGTARYHFGEKPGDASACIKARIERLQLVVLAAESLDIPRLRIALGNLQIGDRRREGMP